MATVKQWSGGRWADAVLALLWKDLRAEFRTRYAINAVLLFVAASVFISSVALGNAIGETKVLASLIWIVIMFAASAGLARPFVVEEESGTVPLLQLNLASSAVYSGKLLYTTIITLAITGLTLLGFVLVSGVEVTHPGWLIAASALGAIGLAGALTLIGAIIARTSTRGPLFAILSFPIVLPLILTAVSATIQILNGQTSAVANNLLWMFAFSGIVITASVLLFDFVWEE